MSKHLKTAIFDKLNMEKGTQYNYFYTKDSAIISPIYWTKLYQKQGSKVLKQRVCALLIF